MKPCLSKSIVWIASTFGLLALVACSSTDHGGETNSTASGPGDKASAAGLRAGQGAVTLPLRGSVDANEVHNAGTDGALVFKDGAATVNQYWWLFSKDMKSALLVENDNTLAIVSVTTEYKDPPDPTGKNKSPLAQGDALGPGSTLVGVFNYVETKRLQTIDITTDTAIYAFLHPKGKDVTAHWSVTTEWGLNAAGSLSCTWIAASPAGMPSGNCGTPSFGKAGGENATLKMEDGGTLVLYTKDNTKVWSSDDI